MLYPIKVYLNLADMTSVVADANFTVSSATITPPVILFPGGSTITYTVLSGDVTSYSFNQYLVNGLQVANANLRADATLTYLLQWKDANDNFVWKLPSSPLFTFDSTTRTVTFTPNMNSQAGTYNMRITATLNGDSTAIPIKD